MKCDDIQNTAELRSLNKKKIFDSLRKHGMLTKRDMADDTQLSFATISSLSNQMEAEGMLQRGGVCTSKGGRIPAMFSIRTDAYFLLAISFAIANRIYMSLLSLNGQRMHEWECSYAPSDSYESVLDKVRPGMDALLNAACVNRENILSGAVAVPAIFDPRTGTVVNSTLPLFEDRHLAGDLRERLGLDLTVENESNLMALACLDNRAEAHENSDIIFLYIGEGLGIGVVSGNRLLSGAHGFGGEVNHMPLGQAGYSCSCGQINCIETELSISGFIRKYNDRHPAQTIDCRQPVDQQWQDFVARCQAQDEIALSVTEENGVLLGRLISSLAGLLDPQRVCIGGNVDQIFQYLLPSVREALAHRHLSKHLGELPIQFIHGYNRLIIAGCAELAYSKWKP